MTREGVFGKTWRMWHRATVTTSKSVKLASHHLHYSIYKQYFANLSSSERSSIQAERSSSLITLQKDSDKILDAFYLRLYREDSLSIDLWWKENCYVLQGLRLKIGSWRNTSSSLERNIFIHSQPSHLSQQKLQEEKTKWSHVISNTPFLIAKRNKPSYTWTLIIISLQTGWEFHQEFVTTSALFTAGAQFSLWPLKSPHPSELGAPHQTCPWWWPGANKQQINDENNKTWLLTLVLTTRLIDTTRRSFCSWKETKPWETLTASDWARRSSNSCWYFRAGVFPLDWMSFFRAWATSSLRFRAVALIPTNGNTRGFQFSWNHHLVIAFTAWSQPLKHKTVVKTESVSDTVARTLRNQTHL